MFVHLGLTNVRRNLGRSALAVTGAAVAAMMVTSIIALAGGYPAHGWAEARSFLGGDIMIYATPHLVRPEQWRQPVAGSWEHARLGPDQMSDLYYLHPELYGHGFLAPGGVAAAPVRLEELKAILATHPRVKGVTAAYFLPVRMRYQAPAEDGATREVELTPMLLRGRDFGVSSEDGVWSFGRLLIEGRVPGPGEEEAPVGLIDRRLISLGYERDLPLDQVVRLYVPRIVAGPDGQVRYDYGQELGFELTIVGHYQVQTNVVAWSDEMGVAQREELFWVTPQIQVPEGFFAAVYRAASGGMELPGAMQFAVEAAPFSEVENIATELRALLPGMTVISVPAQMELAHTRGIPEAVFQAPLELMGLPSALQTGMPVDLSRAFIVLICLIAGLLVASNMLFLVARRRREVGVLRALGARGSDIGLMVLTEALALNLAGTLAGFGLIRIFATWTLITNRIPLAEIGRATLADLALVVAASSLAATAFSLIPAWQMARLTSMEVLRNE